MKKTNKFLLTSVAFLIPFLTYAQSNREEMADVMRSNGKIFVVIGVIGIILSGILIFLLMIDKKVRKLEKKASKK